MEKKKKIQSPCLKHPHHPSKAPSILNPSPHSFLQSYNPLQSHPENKNNKKINSSINTLLIMNQWLLTITA